MKPSTRDNLIYLAVGQGLVALIVADLIYSETHHTKMWMPSRFAFRAVTTSALLTYFVLKQMRAEKATVTQMLAAAVFAVLLQLGIMLRFREVIDQLPGMSYSALALVEMFFAWLLTVRGTSYLLGPRKRNSE